MVRAQQGQKETEEMEIPLLLLPLNEEKREDKKNNQKTK